MLARTLTGLSVLALNPVIIFQVSDIVFANPPKTSAKLFLIGASNLTECAWGDPHFFPERRREVGLTGKTEDITNLGQRELAVSQQFLCGSDPPPEYVLVR